MATSAQFYDQNGELRLDGTLVGGGGSQPVTESAYYSGEVVTVENNFGAVLGWEILDAGTDLLDLTVPTIPVARKAGLFIVTAEVRSGTPMTAGGALSATLILDYGNDNAECGDIGNQEAGLSNAARVLVSGSYVLAAGGALRLSVNNLDGAAARDISIKNATVSRIGPA